SGAGDRAMRAQARQPGLRLQGAAGGRGSRAGEARGPGRGAGGAMTQSGAAMTPEEAERYVLSKELFGMRFGLDRMRRLMTALGRPERRFDSIHVVGTNGKSSTTRMIAAILAQHG